MVSPTSNLQPTVLVLGDEPKLRGELCSGLRRDGFHPLCAHDADEGWAHLIAPGQPAQAVLLDGGLAHAGAADFLARWRELGPEWAPVILLAASRAQVRDASLRDATTALLKPIRLASVLTRLRQVLRRRRARPRASVPRTLDLPLAAPPAHVAR